MKIHNLVQGSDEWAAFRLNHHGASEAAAMLGLSKRTTRSELLRMKHTGTPKEFSDWVQENILDYGHEVEALARPIAEELIGDDLYPVTCSDEDTGGHLSASCDGLTMAGDTAFEHKQWNAELAALVASGTVPDEHLPQCQQIMMITGATRVIFTVSDGTRDNFVSAEVLPDPAWFERIRDGWAQFDRDLTAYTLPEQQPVLVAEAVQALPAVAVQVIGQISVRENFNVFESALRDFLENKLIREPQTDQDFVDLDQQIKAMKKAEDTLNAAEAMMLAQVESIDQAKRQKDMLANLVRDNRLMAEKLLESEKKRRREERIEAARKAFAAHVSGLQATITGLRLDVVMPDFAGAIKGLKTLTSIDDKLDTALANGKIVADRQANDFRAKLAWIAEVDEALEYRALLPDLQQLAAKPLDDFRLAVNARVSEHRRKLEERAAREREQIRQQELARIERERQEAAAQAERERAEAEAAADRDRAAAEPPGPVEAAQAPAAPSIEDDLRAMEDPLPFDTAPPTSEPMWPFETVNPPSPAYPRKTVKLGDINARIAPLSITADGLASLGFHPVGNERAAKLYAESDLIAIYRGLYGVIQGAANELKKAA